MARYNDEPTVDDKLLRQRMIKKLGNEIATCKPPRVYGVHGEWGSGKTSFLYQLQLYLTGMCPQALGDVHKGNKRNHTNMAKKLWGPEWHPKEDVTVIWFDAWQYQHEKAPIVALLQEIRNRLPMMAKVWEKALKLGTVAVESALMNLDSITKVIGFKVSEIKKTGEAWEKEHHAYQLPSQQIRGLLEKAVEPFMTDGGRMVILVDDLDRCEPEVAFRLLEGIKIYLNLKHFVFVLGMDQRIIERAIARSLSHVRRTRERELLAREYLDKICQDIRQLSLVKAPQAYLDGLFSTQTDLVKEVVRVVDKYKILPMNPRKIKSFAGVLDRFVGISVPDNLELLPNGCTRRAGLLALAAALYHFHPKIFKQLQADPLFSDQMLEFARIMRSEHLAFTSLRQNKLTHPLQELPGEVDEVNEMDLNMRFPHPSDDDVFRVRQLVVDLGKVGGDEWRPYLYNHF